MFPLPTKMKNYRARRVMDREGLEARGVGSWCKLLQATGVLPGREDPGQEWARRSNTGRVAFEKEMKALADATPVYREFGKPDSGRVGYCQK